MPRRILCFGDSNTFGWIGRLDGPTRRFPSDIRWTGRLSALLGPDFEILEEGLGGRTLRDHFTVGSGVSVPGAGLCGRDYLPACLLSHRPLDAVIIMLGSNDMKSALGHSEYDIADYVAMKGFISGLYAGNYDITHIFIDSLTKIIGRECDFETEKFLAWLESYSERESINFTLFASNDPEKVSDTIKKYF